MARGIKKRSLSWGNFGIGASSLLWVAKDKIDRQFMARFQKLPSMEPASKSSEPSVEMRCAGCGSKVGATVLERVLQRLERIKTTPRYC